MLDGNLVFCDGQAVTGSVASTNIIDLGANREFVGHGGDLVAHVSVTETFQGGTSISAKLEHADAEGGPYSDIGEGQTFLVADAVAGTPLLSTRLPISTKRFLRLQFDVVGTMTGGRVSGNIQPKPVSATNLPIDV